MTQSNHKIAALIGSRICHDLISPVGAVCNGLELLEMAGGAQTPEMELVSDSAASASARIRLFRLAFGTATPGHEVAAQEVGEVLAALYNPGRTQLRWMVRGAHDRPLMKALLLAFMCVEHAIPGKGILTVSGNGQRFTLRAEGARLSHDPALWGVLEGASLPESLPPSAVEFALLPELLAQLGRKAFVQSSDTELEMAF